MKIDISTQESRDLLDILHIADVVMAGHRREEDNRTSRHRVLIQKLYSLVRTEGLNRLISHDQGLNRYVPTAEFEHLTLAHPLLEEYGEHRFWDHLISRLSVRDATQIAGGAERLNAMNDGDRQQLEGPIRQRYLEEFTSNGVANLEITERFGTGRGLPLRTSD